jgi:hypothetical protein
MYLFSSSKKASDVVFGFAVLVLLTSFIYVQWFKAGLTTPAHGDIYGYSVLFDDIPYYSVPFTPRPIMGLFLKIGGVFNFSGMMIFLSLIGICSYIAPIIAYCKIFNKTVPLTGWVIYVLLVSSYPAHYLGLVHDIGARVAFICAMISIVYYSKYYKESYASNFMAGAFWAVFGFLSKETYGPCLVLLVIYLGAIFHARPRSILLAASSVVLCLIISLVHSRYLGSPFTSNSSSYLIDFNVINVAISASHFITLALSPQLVIVIAAVAGVLIVTRCWNDFLSFFVLFLVSLSSIIPNAMLTKHGGSNYEMILVPFLALLPVIYIDRLDLLKYKKTILLLVSPLLLIANFFWGDYSLGKNYWWEMGIAHYNHKAIKSMAHYAVKIRSSRNILVLGLQQDHIVQPWTPFTSAKYLVDSNRFKDTIFYVVGKGYSDIFGNQNDKTRIYTEDLKGVPLSSVDLVLLFDASGDIREVLDDRRVIDNLGSLGDIDYTKVYNKEYWGSKVAPFIYYRSN